MKEKREKNIKSTKLRSKMKEKEKDAKMAILQAEEKIEKNKSYRLFFSHAL